MTYFNQTDRKKFYILLGITLVYVFPIILANTPYIDDLERIISGIGTDWKVDYRPLSWLLTEALSFGEPLTDSAPLLLICGVIILTAGMTCFGKRYFNEYGFRNSILILTSGIFCPFLLENFSYHYESLFMLTGPGLLLALFSLQDKSWKTALLAIIVVLAVLSMYQVFICIFLCLSILECFYNIKQLASWAATGKALAKRIAETIAAIALYLFCTAYIFPSPGPYVIEHGGILTPTNPLFTSLLQQHIGYYVKLLQDFFFTFNPVLQILALCILAAYVLQLSADYWRHAGRPPLQKTAAILLFFLTPFFLVILTFLPLAFLVNPVVFPRVMMAFMIFWMFLFSGIPYLAEHYHCHLNILFLPFLLFCFVFSCSYSQTLKAEYEHEHFIVSMIATDLIKLNRPVDSVTFVGRVPPSHQYTLGEKKFPLFPRLITIYMDNKRYWGSVLLNHYGLPLKYSPLLTQKEMIQTSQAEPTTDNRLYSLHILDKKVVITFHEK